MPVKYRIEKLADIVHAEAYGALTDTEALAHQRDLKADPDFDPSYREFFDFTAVTPFWITPQGIHILAANSPWKDGARRAFVAKDDLAYGMLRMFQSLLDGRGQQVAVFRTASEAWEWLGQTKGSDSSSAQP